MADHGGDAAVGGLTRLAPAKVNLCLHVVGRRDDGYHLLESLVAFPEIGDAVTVEPHRGGISLAIDGPFKDQLAADADNLVLRAASALRRQVGRPDLGAAILLTKRLPIASGIGGGSSDAAATLLLLDALWGLGLGRAALADAALGLGADVPACLYPERMLMMRGVGERLEILAPPPAGAILLVNPGVAAPTPDVFRALRMRENPPPPRPPEAGFRSLDVLADWLHVTRNDLEPPAVALQPVIQDVLDALAALDSARHVGMSGSGATCFALFDALAEAERAATILRSRDRTWWVEPARLGAHTARASAH